jgi:hypothetical protein
MVKRETVPPAQEPTDVTSRADPDDPRAGHHGREFMTVPVELLLDCFDRGGRLDRFGVFDQTREIEIFRRPCQELGHRP